MKRIKASLVCFAVAITLIATNLLSGIVYVNAKQSGKIKNDYINIEWQEIGGGQGSICSNCK